MEIEAIRNNKKVTGKDGKEKNKDYLPYTYLMSESVDMWTQSYDGGRHFGAITTNISECFNGVVKGAQGLPIAAMVKFTWSKLVEYFHNRHKKITHSCWKVRNGVHMPSPRGREIGVNLRNTISRHLAINI